MTTPAASSPAIPYKILRLYLKGSTVEVPHMVDVPRQAISPEVGVDMQTSASSAWPGALECVLRISLHAKLAGKTIFLIEVSQAGVFEISTSETEETQRFVRKIAPSVLFPFARKDLANLTVSAGFQPVLLDHIDFDTMLAQVAAAHRLRQAPVAMRLDLMPAKQPQPASPSSPVNEAPEPSLQPHQPDTPAPLSQEDQLRLRATPSTAALRHTRRTWAGIVVLGAAVGAGFWLTRSAAPSPTQAVSAAPSTPATMSPPPVTAKPEPQARPAMPVIPVATQEAIAASRVRLAEQPPQWFTLDLGRVPLTASLDELVAPQDKGRPVFVVGNGEAGLRLLYGVFPTRAYAEKEALRLRQQRADGVPARAAEVVEIGAV